MNGYSTTLIDASGKSIALHAYKDSEVGSFDAASKNMNTLLTFSTRTGPGSMLYQDALDNVVCLCK